MSTNGHAVYLDATRRNKTISFRRLTPRGESLKEFKLDEPDAEKMVKAMEEEKLNNEMFLVDVIATAAVVLNTYLGKTADRPEMTVEMGAKLAYMAGKIYTSQSEWKLAFGSYNTSKSLWKKLANRDENTNAAITEIYFEIGELLAKQGKYQQAIGLYRKNVDYWQNQSKNVDYKKKQSNNVNIARASFCLAECLLLSSRHADAQKEFKSVLQLQQKMFGEVTPNSEVARTLNRIGWCHREQGNYNKACESYNASLKMRKQLYGEGDHLDFAETLNSLGIAYSELGNNDEAVKHAKDALEMRQRLKNKFLIAESLNNLGCCLMGEAAYEQARVNLEMVLNMKEEFYGDVDHPSIAITLENFAKCLVLLKKDNSGLALEYAQQALQMKKRCLGDVSNPAIAKTLEIVSLCLEKVGNLKDAIKYLKGSMHMIENTFTPTHPTFVRTKFHLSQLILMQKESDEAN